MVAQISEDDRKRIETAVKTAEARTSAEIVVMMLRGVTDYRSREYLLAAVISLALPAVLLPFTGISALVIWTCQIALFVALALGFTAGSVGRYVVGAERVATDVRGAAQAQFFGRGMRRTSKRAAVLLFVALDEHRVEVLYDDAAAAVLKDGPGERMATDLAAAIGKGDIVGGIEQAVLTLSTQLEGDLPVQDDDINELPDVIIG